MNLNYRFTERHFLVQATAIGALTAAAAYVSLKNYRKLTAVIDVTNGTTVTGASISLTQAQAIAGTGAKTLALTRMLANLDVAASQTPDALVENAVASNAFTTDTTNAKRLRYVLEIDAEDLDANNNFDCVRVNALSMANASGQISYILWGARYSGAEALSN